MLSYFIDGAQSRENNLPHYEFMQVFMDFLEEALRKGSDYEDGELYEHDHKLEWKFEEASAYDGFLVPFVEISSLIAYPTVRVFHLFDIPVLLECLLNVLVCYKG
jgi:hypothetical protein